MTIDELIVIDRAMKSSHQRIAREYTPSEYRDLVRHTRNTVTQLVSLRMLVHYALPLAMENGRHIILTARPFPN